MNADRRAAIVAGVLYVMGTVTGVLSVVVSGPITGAPDFLAAAAANPSRVVISALFVLAMALSLASMAVVLYPVLRKHNPTLAAGYLVYRGALETFTYFVTVIGFLMLIPLGQAYVAAGMPADSVFQVLGALVADEGGWVTQLVTVVFITGAVMFYVVLWQARLVPRWLSGWGLVGTVPYLLAGFLVLFGAIENFSSTDALLRMPVAFQEMVLAGWMIVRGFRAVSPDEVRAPSSPPIVAVGH